MKHDPTTAEKLVALRAHVHALRCVVSILSAALILRGVFDRDQLSSMMSAFNVTDDVRHILDEMNATVDALCDQAGGSDAAPTGQPFLRVIEGGAGEH